MDKQFHGSTVDLNQNAPLNVEHDGKTGSMEKQLLGSQVPLSTTPVPLQIFDKGTLNGEIQTQSESHAPLNFTPQHGYEGSKTPMSQRAVQASK